MSNFSHSRDATNGSRGTPINHAAYMPPLDQQLEDVPANQSGALANAAQHTMNPSLLNESFADPNYRPTSYIRGEADFHFKMEAYLTMCDQELDQGAIADFPPDEASQQALVQQLVAAMIYMGPECEDATSMKSVNKINKLSPVELNLMAWKLLLDTRDCQLGKTGMPRWGKDWAMEQFDTFHQRFASVKDALHRTKASVASLFDYTFTKRLALNPSSEVSKIRGNKTLNRNRKTDLAIAKQEKERLGLQPNARCVRRTQTRTRNRLESASSNQAVQAAAYTPANTSSMGEGSTESLGEGHGARCEPQNNMSTHDEWGQEGLEHTNDGVGWSTHDERGQEGLEHTNDGVGWRDMEMDLPLLDEDMLDQMITAEWQRQSSHSQ